MLPHRAVAKIDMRLVPDMTAADTLAKLKAHLAKHGFGDIEVNMSGGYDPTQTDPNSKLIQTQLATYRKLGQEPLAVAALGGLLARLRLHQRAAVAGRPGTSASGTAPGRTLRMSTT